MNEGKLPTPPASGKTALATVMGGAAAASLLLATLTSYEGKRNVGYLDIAKIPTACMGDTDNVTVGKFYTDAECIQRLERQAIAHAAEVKRCTPRITGSQLVAAASLTYNIGGPAYCGSTAAKRFNAGDLRGGCNAMLAWNKARVNGVLTVVRGLANRRAGERAICVQGLPA